jgi:hypothetical protein
MVTTTIDQIVSEHMLGKTITFFTRPKNRENYIGKEIEQINICSTDDGICGVNVFVRGVNNPIFIEDTEQIQLDYIKEV